MKDSFNLSYLFYGPLDMELLPPLGSLLLDGNSYYGFRVGFRFKIVPKEVTPYQEAFAA